MALANVLKLTTGCAVLDQKLSGGIPTRSITEIISESGGGKTQMCLQIALQAQRPVDEGGLAGCCVFYCTDYNFPVRRLRQYASALVESQQQSVEALTETVLVKNVEHARGLIVELDRLNAHIISTRPTPPVKLVIIDSFASLFRSQFDRTHDQMRSRCRLFHEIARTLRRMARQHSLAVVTTNHVVAYFGDGEGALQNTFIRELWTSGSRVVPALGPTWAVLADTKLFLSRATTISIDPMTNVEREILTRRLMLLYATHLRFRSIRFVIESTRVRAE